MQTPENFCSSCPRIMHVHLGPITPQYLHFHLRDASWLKLLDGCYQPWLPRCHPCPGWVHSFVMPAISLTWCIQQICKASLSHLFRLICGLSSTDLDSLHLDEELHLVLKLSAELRSMRRELSQRFHTKFHTNIDPVTRGCRACYNQPEDSKCVRYWTVEPGYHSDIHGKVVTPYPANDPDRLPTTGKVRILVLIFLSVFKLFHCRAGQPIPIMFL